MNLKKKKNGEMKEFEYCEVCRLNHNQGRRHNFFPRHKTSLCTLLTRFKSKLSDAKWFIRTPALLRQEHADKYRVWCIFCNCDVLGLDSPFACGNAINHLAGGGHRKRVKSFMWRYGGGMDQVDMFCIAEVDYAKWEKKCKSLKKEATAAESVGNVAVPSNNIHNELNANYDSSFQKNNVNFLDFETTNSVIPLRSSTNERAQVSCPVLSSFPEAGYSWHNMPRDTQIGERLKTPTGCIETFQINSVGRENSSCSYYSNGSENSGARTANGESRSHGLLNLTQISSISQEVIEENVHTGAPPPWFNAEGNQVDITQKPELSNLTPSTARKSLKLNPKRVGAAWAERRALELELEKRGEPVGSNFDTNWLPNFGRVWQSGTRKESRKEFQAEKKSSLDVDTQSERLMPVQPYVRKRMHRDTANAFN